MTLFVLDSQSCKTQNCGEHLSSKICSPCFLSAHGLKDNICLAKVKLI